MREVTRILRANGSLKGSPFSNLLQAVIDEGQLQDPQVKEDEHHAFGWIKKRRDLKV